MSTTDRTSDIERVATQHAEAALCHLAHVTGITFGDVAFDRDRDRLAEDIATYLAGVERRARGGMGDVVDEATDQLRSMIDSFGRVDSSNISGVVQDAHDQYGVSVWLHRVGEASATNEWSFDRYGDVKAFLEDAREIIERAT